MKKVFFPFDYWNSFEKFKEALLSKEKFYDTLNNGAINHKNCKHVLSAWKAFKMNTMKYYDDLYLKVDILLLAYVFETFRNEFINSLELEPAHCLSTSVYS